MKQVQENIVSLDQILNAKKEFDTRVASDVSNRLKDLSKSMNK